MMGRTPVTRGAGPFFCKLPGLAWLMLFFLIPLGLIAATSFLSRNAQGEVGLPLTLSHYSRAMGFGTFGFDAVYLRIFLRTLVMAGLTTAGCILIALPVSFQLARLSPRKQFMALALLMVPFWTNLLVRTYGWQVLLGPDGWVTQTFVTLGVIENGLALYPSAGAVLVGLVCDYLPFMILPLYVAMRKLDWRLVEAGRDLGAPPIRLLQHTILPQLQTALGAGILMVFLPAMGQFVLPDLLGGAKTMLLGNLLQQQFSQSRDWPFGATIAVCALGLAFVLGWLREKLVRPPMSKEGV